MAALFVERSARGMGMDADLEDVDVVARQLLFAQIEDIERSIKYHQEHEVNDLRVKYERALQIADRYRADLKAYRSLLAMMEERAGVLVK